MAQTFILSCESTVDLPYSYIEGRGIPVLFYHYTVNGQDYVDDMGRDPEGLTKFYARIAQGALPSTSQLNTYDYMSFLESLLAQGDVLHIAFGSGMTKSVERAQEAAQALREKYPNRRLVVIDSTCSSSGYGMLVDDAADLRDRGESMETVEAWVLAHSHRIHHQFFSTDLSYYRRGGRVSGAAATIGTILNLCPLMHLNYDGRIIAYGKTRGQKNAIREAVNVMRAHAEGGESYQGKCFICHSDCLGTAHALRDAVVQAFPNLKADDIRICDIGTIIASHTGPNTAALFFMGDDRPR
ncbi:MAG: DegV family protein [Eubacteriales bacterium]|nr:DegV family protein [Clostridiales bacterium]MDY2769321.1 DegV family protein [Eubacteriales bacterium]